MIPLFNLEKINEFKHNEKLPLKCEKCNAIFYAKCKDIKSVINRSLNEFKYCSMVCFGSSISKISDENCANCLEQLKCKNSRKKKSKSGKIFCSRSCSVTYHNTHKTSGTRRSKLEIWLEEQLKILFPNLQIIFNGKETVNSELDIYIPSLKLAFELNGIFHYEPIYGSDKLDKIQNNDNRKFQACLEQGIELVIIDSSSLKYFKPTNAQKYLDIIKKIISNKCEEEVGVEPTRLLHLPV